MAESKRQKLLIFVIAYYAESTLWRVLERIPAALFSEFDCEILVVDDASDDRTFLIGSEYRQANPHIAVTVLRNEYNQGYGGNQKVGYTYAQAEGFDFVAMVHGDGQYAPEALPQLLAPLVSGEADAVFGSRMLERFGALRGGMPLYKFVGNRILSTLQNALLRTSLSEFHSGYRIYSVQALAKIPYQLNSNDYHFDTEIIIQLLNSRARITELPIPTYYGNEICRVNGMKYAKNVVWATMQSVAHRAGLLYQRRFDADQSGNAHYDLKLGYPSSHTYALDAVAPGAHVLDIGSGPGGLAVELTKKGCSVTVVDRHLPASVPDGIAVEVRDLDDNQAIGVVGHDTLLLLDVIEHLKDPEQFLERLREGFDYEPRRLILTTPNIAFVAQRVMLLLGQFNYGKTGILDRTHKRLFTFRSIRHLLRDAGFKIKTIKGVPAPFPKVLGQGTLGKLAIDGNLLLIRLSKTLFSYQIYVVAETTPSARFVLENAKQQSSRGIHISPVAAPAAASDLVSPPLEGALEQVCLNYAVSPASLD